MPIQRTVVRTMTAVTTLTIAACRGNDATPPLAPTPPTVVVTANAYILPNAVSLGPEAFGDEPLVIYKGERLRWVNIDALTHAVVADTPGATDFLKTDTLPSNGEQSLIMAKTGTTTIHCAIHPQMTGTLTVRDR
jgi:plastocyanin